jgi:hypothetical protein
MRPALRAHQKNSTAVAFSLTAILLGCDSSPDPFGRTYEACLQKKLVLAEGVPVEPPTALCQQHFEKSPAQPANLAAGGDMIANADGTASFEFRLSNDRADVIVTGFTVTATFYDGEAASKKALATYRWSFRSPVAPQGQLLEYGALDANAVAALKKLHAGAPGADPLANSVYAFTAKIDTQVELGRN